MNSVVAKERIVADSRLNNLDSLRLILASLVVIAHANNLFHVAQGSDYRFGFFLLNMSDIAVSAFFLISGMLTYASFERDPNIERFYARRFFRVFPAYWTVVILQAVTFLAISFPIVDFQDFYKYITLNLLTANFLMPSFVDGIQAFNGSLWTIKIEATYYLVLPFIFPILLSRRLFPVLMICSFAWAITFPNDELARQLPGKLYLFGVGIVIARIPRAMAGDFALPALICLPLGLVLYFLVKGTPVLDELAAMLCSVFLVLVFLRQWVRWEPLDISYTLYLVHYPIEVMITRYIAPDIPFWQMLMLSVVLSIPAAVTLSFIVERPALNIGRRFVRQLNSRPCPVEN